MTNPILSEDCGKWTKVTLNRPEKLNCFNADMLRLLYKILFEISESDKRAILITGNGRAFCAGQDLSERDPNTKNWPPDLRKILDQGVNPIVKLITELPMPVVSAVNGVAAGAGANLALASDLVIASDKAKFIQAFSKIGLAPDAGGSWTLPNKVGLARAIGLAFSGKPLSARKAVKWGLIWRSYDDDLLMLEAQKLLDKLANGPTLAYAKTKFLMRNSLKQSFQDQLNLEAQTQLECAKSKDYTEGISAFLEKRSPNFKGY